jgi:hypothetical protein
MTLPIAPDPGPMARFAALKAGAEWPKVIFQRVADGETLKDLSREWELPRGEFVSWYTTEHSELYDAALKVRADELAHESLTIADEQAEVVKKDGTKFDPDVARDKLRVDTRIRILEKWDRARYGNKEDKSGSGITVIVDRSCGGTVEISAGGATARIPLQPQEKVINELERI